MNSMKALISTVFLIFIHLQLHAFEVKYSLRMTKPQNHYFQVEMKVDGLKQKSALLKLPVWAPGSYLVREFSKNVNQVKAVDANGKELQVIKISKNAWEVLLDGATSFSVNYEVYAFELSVRTSFLDDTHGFVSGSGVFMYVDGHKDESGKLAIYPNSAFKKVTTALDIEETDKVYDGAASYTFANYDQLVDCPIEIGNQLIFEFYAANVKHTVAMYGDANYEVEKLKKDMTKIIEEETKVFGVNPNNNYVFIIHNVPSGDGGLEHCNSTVLSVDRWTYDETDYLSFLNLVAHEYFHLWNVKRIRPIELGPFDYDHEVYTSMLWVMEGFTSYYDELIMLRCGFYTQDEFLKKFQSSINYVEGSVGSRVQPVAHASFDAWIKAYRPNENSGNTTMTYYSRGSVLGAVFDAMIISKSNGKKCLDDFMKDLYQTYYLGKNRGFTELEFRGMLETHTGQNLNSFYKNYIDGTEIIPYSTYFIPLGLEIKDIGGVKPVFGATVNDEGGKVIVKSIRTGSAAEDAGLSVNDEVISCMNYRVNKAMLDGLMNGFEIGDEVDLLISRDQLIRLLTVKITGQKKSQFVFNFKSDEKTLPLYNYWLR